MGTIYLISERLAWTARQHRKAGQGPHDSKEIQRSLSIRYPRNYVEHDH